MHSHHTEQSSKMKSAAFANIIVTSGGNYVTDQIVETRDTHRSSDFELNEKTLPS